MESQLPQYRAIGFDSLFELKATRLSGLCDHLAFGAGNLGTADLRIFGELLQADIEADPILSKNHRRTVEGRLTGYGAAEALPLVMVECLQVPAQLIVEQGTNRNGKGDDQYREFADDREATDGSYLL